jgi:hypothetical protein
VVVRQVNDTNDTKITSSTTVLERLPLYLLPFNDPVIIS